LGYKDQNNGEKKEKGERKEKQFARKVHLKVAETPWLKGVCHEKSIFEGQKNQMKSIISI
jgi:hypothetical protein